MAENVLLVKNLRKVFGDIVAVNDISFELTRSEIVGLLGILKPTAGSVEVNGMEIGAHRSKVLERTNFAAVYAPCKNMQILIAKLIILLFIIGCM